MKKIAKISMLVVAGLLVFTGCKKGENDPTISLTSRTKRLCQEWELTAGSVTSSQKNDMYTANATSTYNGSTVTTSSSITMSGTTTTSTETHLFTNVIEFVKDGTFEETTNEDGDIEIRKGIWSWLYENQEQELKNKEAVVLSSNTDGTTTASGLTIYPDNIIVFDELSKDEIIIILDYSESDLDGNTSSYTGTMTFEPK